MTQYKNLSGDSAVFAYQISDDAVMVQFKDGSVYLYTKNMPGNEYVDQMKALAENGMGLNGYISKVVKKRFAAKLR